MKIIILKKTDLRLKFSKFRYKKIYGLQDEVGEKEQKKDSEEIRENNSSKISIKNIYSKPVFELENDEILKKIVIHSFH